MAKVNFRDLKKFTEQLNKLNKEQVKQFNEAAIKELAARLLQKVRLRTPVGDYSREIKVTAKRNSKNHKKGDVYTKRVNTSGKVGGTLRRSWTVGEVVKNGNNYSIEIINPTKYASYVEFGHRTRNHTGWVEGKFMMTISEKELEADAPRILENELNRFLGEIFNA